MKIFRSFTAVFLKKVDYGEPGRPTSVKRINIQKIIALSGSNILFQNIAGELFQNFLGFSAICSDLKLTTDLASTRQNTYR